MYYRRWWKNCKRQTPPSDNKLGKKCFNKSKMTLDSLLSPDLFYLINLLRPKDLISLISSSQQLKGTFPNNKNRLLNQIWAIYQGNQLPDTVDTKYFSSSTHTKLMRHYNDRNSEIELLGENSAEKALEICPKPTNVSKTCCV